jgi:hypothetical protein
MLHAVNAKTTTYRSDDRGGELIKPKTVTSPDVSLTSTAVQSPTSAAKLTFQSFANLIPFSWSPLTPQRIDESLPLQDAEPLGRFSFVNGDRKLNLDNREKYYVSKEKQLEKLRSRFEEEERLRKFPGGAPNLCGKCDDKFVNL